MLIVPTDCEPCPLLPGQQCIEGFYTELTTQACIQCPSTIGQVVSGIAMALAVVCLLVALFKYTGRESARLASFKPTDVQIYTDPTKETVHDLATTLRDALAEHLSRDKGMVYIDSEAETLSPGDRVVVTSADGSDLAGSRGVVKSVGDSVMVQLDGQSKPHELTQNELRQRNTSVITSPAQAPAVIVYLTPDNIASPDFFPNLVAALAGRAGIDTAPTLDDDESIHEEIMQLPDNRLAALRAGCCFIVCDDSVRDSPEFARLTSQDDGLGIEDTQVFRQPDDDDESTQPQEKLLEFVASFLDEERLSEEHKQMCEDFASSTSSLSESLAGLVRNKALAQHAARASAGLRISLPHIQIVSWSWGCDWAWPPFVATLREYVASFIQIDINTAAKPECTPVSRWYASTLTAFALMGFVVLLIIVLATRYKCAKSDNPRQDAAKKAHVVSFTLALYTLAFPILVTQAVRWLDWTPNTAGGKWTNNEVANVTKTEFAGVVVAVALASVWLLILTVLVPRKLFVRLRNHHEADRLHTAEVHASLGWLYDKYTDDAYWHELGLLESRFVVILSGTLVSGHDKTSAIVSQCICMVATCAVLALQLKKRPFAEDVAAAAHWSSLNKQAAMALFCQFVALGLGLVSTVMEAGDADTSTTLGLVIVLGILIAFATPLLLTIAAEVVALRGIASVVTGTGVVAQDGGDDGESDDGKGVVENPTFTGEDDE